MSTMDFLYLESSAEMSILYMQLCTFLICNNVHFYYAINTESDIKLADDAVVHYSFVRNKLYNSIEKELNGRYWEIMYLTRRNKRDRSDKTAKENI